MNLCPPCKRCAWSHGKKHLPDYEIKVWGVGWNVGRFRFTKEAYENRQWAFVSDVIRLDTLYKYSGIYLDMDVEVLKSFNPLLHHEFFTGTERDYVKKACTPYIIGAQKGNALIKELLSFYDDLPFVRHDGKRNTVPVKVGHGDEGDIVIRRDHAGPGEKAG